MADPGSLLKTAEMISRELITRHDSEVNHKKIIAIPEPSKFARQFGQKRWSKKRGNKAGLLFFQVSHEGERNKSKIYEAHSRANNNGETSSFSILQDER